MAATGRMTRFFCGKGTVTVAWCVFLAGAIAIGIMTGVQGRGRSVTGEYRAAAEKWWKSESLYTEGTQGFLYFPQAAIAFTPFQMLPPEVGEPLWRVVGLGLFAAGVWRLSRAGKGSAGDIFLPATLLAIPAMLASLENGQSNLHMAALMIHAALALRGEKWWLAAALLGIALVLKPLAMVMILLTAALYLRPMAWRLGIVLLAVLLLPWLHPDPSFVWSQHVACFEKLRASTTPINLRVSDVFGMLGKFGVTVSDTLGFLIRAGAALVFLALGRRATQRFGATGGAVLVGTLAAVYLVLFNPRTETNSYVLVSSYIGVAAAAAIFSEGRRILGWVLAAIALALACDGYGTAIYRATDVWLKPLVTSVFFLILAVQLAVGARPPALAADSAPATKPKPPPAGKGKKKAES